jgi:hypothetical protein
LTEPDSLDVTAWFRATGGHKLVPIFEEEAPLQVVTRISGGRRLLCRSQEMETAVIDMVEAGLGAPDWEGLLYVMGWGEPDAFKVLYVGKAERKGVKHPISANIVSIRTNKHKFARWGDGLSYHIGDLSQALFGFKAYRQAPATHRRWAQTLFTTFEPPVLKQRVYLYLIPWFSGMTGPSGLAGSLPAVEKEVIALAGFQFADSILNRDGV